MNTESGYLTNHLVRLGAIAEQYEENLIIGNPPKPDVLEVAGYIRWMCTQAQELVLRGDLDEAAMLLERIGGALWALGAGSASTIFLRPKLPSKKPSFEKGSDGRLRWTEE